MNLKNVMKNIGLGAAAAVVGIGTVAMTGIVSALVGISALGTALIAGGAGIVAFNSVRDGMEKRAPEGFKFDAVPFSLASVATGVAIAAVFNAVSGHSLGAAVFEEPKLDAKIAAACADGKVQSMDYKGSVLTISCSPK